MKILSILRADEAAYRACDLCLWRVDRGSLKRLTQHYKVWHLIQNETAIQRLLAWKRMAPGGPHVEKNHAS